MAKYLIVKEECCKICNGEGFVEYDDWADFNATWSRIHEQEHRPMTDEETNEWWSERGYDPNDLPDEEYECGTCFGKKVTRTEVTLEEALRSFGLIGTEE